MNRSFRTAAMMTLWATYGALWVVVVMMGGPPQRPVGTVRWLLSAAGTLFLMGTLFVVGLFMAPPAGTDAMRSRRRVPRVSTVVGALITVGALLGLVASLRATLFGGPAWLRWAVVGLAAGGTVVGSGRRMGWAALGGLIWSGLGLWSGLDQAPIRRVDLLLTSVLVGTMLGAVGGTLMGRSRERKR